MSRFSVGQNYERGIRNSNHSNSKDTYTEASASFLYDLERKRSEHTFDYHGAARYYNRFSGLDVVSHEAGIGQQVRWTPRLTTSLRYRYSFTPDFQADLLQESVSQELSLMDFFAVSRPLTIPADKGLVTLRSVRMTHSGQLGLSYQPTFHTKFSLEGNFQRLRYQDDNLFGSEQAGVSGQVERSLTPRTAVGLAYLGGWFHQPGGLDRTIVHSGILLLSRQLTPHMTINVAGGRWWAHSKGSEAIPLSPVLSELLGTPALFREASNSFSFWTGSADLLTHWNKVNFGLKYNRSIMNNNLLSKPAETQSFTLNLARQFGESAILSASVVYQQSEFFSLRNLGRIDQGVAAVNFTRRLIAGLDFSLFGNYAKILKGVERPFRFDHVQAGVRFSFHLPRVRPG